MGKSKKRGFKRKKPNKMRRRKTSAYRVGIYSIPVRRTFNFYPRLVDPTGANVFSWLDKLQPTGTIPCLMQTVSIPKANGVDLFAVACVQTMLIGFDDLIVDAPIAEKFPVQKDNQTVYMLPKLDFRTARMDSIHVEISPCAELSRRGGFICACLLPVNVTESDEYIGNSPPVDMVLDHNVTTPSDDYTFSALQQYPGAVTKNASQSIVFRQRLTGYNKLKQNIGQPYVPGVDDLTAIRGGGVQFKLHFGYSDLANPDSEQKLRFSPEEAMFYVTVKGVMHLMEPGHTVIRARPLVTMKHSQAAVYTTSGLRCSLPSTSTSGVPVSPVSHDQLLRGFELVSMEV
jgi:hypothetical protein